ncbi:hypothetical protein L2K70_11160 [Nocardioides KLBMP 9356]|uniref:Tetratricopeptide repeat protein n=1 Tax=Nocardioides potassii TaxID=2911371 RepID=A0ABS9HAE5_9ACTN|nr:hypothetical protein [Nocardioides potassii]MCF6378161.1 hypothetical protein [Nocardioides potassii]
MLQVSAGRFFRDDAPLNETTHRYTAYGNAFFPGSDPVSLPVGTVIPSSDTGAVSSVMLEVVDRLEKKRADGTDDYLIATGGTDLVDDLAHVMTFAMNRTFSRDHDQVRRLVMGNGAARGRSARDLFPGLFEPRQVITAEELADLRAFMEDLLALGREDFARVMRAIRGSVGATRRALDDPMGAYTDLVAALESLSDAELSTPVTWDRYDGSKRKILDAALAGLDPGDADRVRSAVLEADRAGLRRRFVASTLARTSADYYRHGASGASAPPREPDMERLLAVAYDIRSRRSHVLEDLGEGVWLFTDGAETAYEPRVERVLTLAGLWRLTRHVVRRYVADADQPAPEPWNYRDALPGLVEMRVAPQYWIGHTGSLVETAGERLEGLAEALMGWIGGHHSDGIPLDAVCREIEATVPGLPDGEARTALVAVHALWHAWVDPAEHRPEAVDFVRDHADALKTLSPAAFTAAILSGDGVPEWSVDEWALMARARAEARRAKGAAPLPAAIDALIQLEAADQLERAGRHDEAVVLAANAVGEMPGDRGLVEWEARLVAGDHDPDFDWRRLLFGEPPDPPDPDDATDPTDPADAPDGTGANPQPVSDGSGVPGVDGDAGGQATVGVPGNPTDGG